jgi:hypothetical protein
VELLWHALIWPAGRLVAVGPLGSGQSSVIAVSFIFKGTGSSVREMMSGARSSRPYFRSHRPRGVVASARKSGGGRADLAGRQRLSPPAGDDHDRPGHLGQVLPRELVGSAARPGPRLRTSSRRCARSWTRASSLLRPARSRRPWRTAWLRDCLPEGLPGRIATTVEVNRDSLRPANRCSSCASPACGSPDRAAGVTSPNPGKSGDSSITGNLGCGS